MGKLQQLIQLPAWQRAKLAFVSVHADLLFHCNAFALWLGGNGSGGIFHAAIFGDNHSKSQNDCNHTGDGGER